MPSDDFHRPVGKITELVLEEVERGQELTVVPRELRPEFTAQCSGRISRG